MNKVSKYTIWEKNAVFFKHQNHNIYCFFQKELIRILGNATSNI